MPRRLALHVESILRITSWMAAPILAEIATRWIGDGTAQRLVEIQRTRLAERHRIVHSELGEFVIGKQVEALSVWLSVPKHWHLDSLVQKLRNRQIAVTFPDPFLVNGTPRPNAIRVCLGAEGGDVRINATFAVMASVFRQCPRVNDCA